MESPRLDRLLEPLNACFSHAKTIDMKIDFTPGSPSSVPTPAPHVLESAKLKSLTSETLLTRTKQIAAEERRLTLLFNGTDLRASGNK
jgi:hypothetical protein